MPSLFNGVPAGIEATQCPKFNADTLQLVITGQREALANLRLNLGREWAQQLPDSDWEVDGNGYELFPDPPNDAEHQDLQRLRTVLPIELQTAINRSGFAREQQEQMALAAESNLAHYQACLAYHNVPQHEDRLARAEQSATHLGYPPESTPDPGAQPILSMIPTGSSNTIDTPRRYFRMLVWNLENFTRDRRPRGSAPVDSLRNQARIAIVAEAMRLYEVDLLLVMETGYDVGPAMTAIASRLDEIAGEPPHGTHPLVSPPTGALPSVAKRYARRNLGRRTVPKVLALRTLFEVYNVSAQDTDLPLTTEQLLTGWRLLRELSSLAGNLLPEAVADDVAIETASGRVFPNPDLVTWLRNEFVKINGLDGTASDLPDQMYRLASDLGTLIGIEARSIDIDLSSPATLGVLYELSDDVQDLRLYVDYANEDFPDSDARARIVVYARALEFLALCFFQSIWRGIPQDQAGLVFLPGEAEGDRLVLALYLTAVSSALDFDEIDPLQGPLEGEVDRDVVLDALQRLGFAERHIETYGMVYRPPCSDSAARLLAEGVVEHGYADTSDAQAASYDIVRAPLLSGDFTIQDAQGLLNWRSALQVTVPVSDTLSVPLLVFHTRFSGSQAITAAYTQGNGPARLNAEEATVRARTQTLSQMAGALLPGHSTHGMPLIVGDFNIPANYLEPDPDNKPTVRRKQGIREELFRDMAAAGYLRHTCDGTPGEKHPLTTLKSFGSLAMLQASGSQPYDGVYQPFDFAGRKALVRSGVVSFSAIISAQVMSATIKGTVNQGAEVILEEADASDMMVESDMDEDDNANNAAVAEETVGRAASLEVARVYAASARRLIRGIGDLQGWVDRLKYFDDNKDSPRYAKRAPPAGLLDRLNELVTHGQNVLPDHVNARETWFAECMSTDQYIEFAAATGQPDPLDTCRQRLQAAILAATNWDQPHDGLEALSATLTDVATQLRNFELEANVRLAVAYRAVVSDHLPQIIELDLQPGP